MMASIWMLAVAVGATSVPAVAGTIDASNYRQQQGWKRYDTTSLPRSPVPDVVPLMFYDKGNSVPSCGVLTASVRKSPMFIELVGSDPGVGFPQCLSIPAITPFKLQNKEYIVIEYLSRETREDVDRHFHYLVWSEARGFVTDKLLTEAAPVTTAGKGATGSATAKSMDGVRFARLAQLGKAQSTWRMVKRDLIFDKASSFATFEDKSASRCQFVTEAGASPVVTSHDAFAPLSKCDSVLASSRFEKGAKIYYLAMFKTLDKKQLVGVTSVAVDGHIAVEKTLAESINRSGVTKDMKTAKAALMKQIKLGETAP